MLFKPMHFIAAEIEVEFEELPRYEKKPHCPVRFHWEGQTHEVTTCVSEWHDYGRRGRMAHNMRPSHAAAAARRGSWGVGRYYFRVRVQTGQVFDLYYDRAPGDAEDRKGSWILFREMRAEG
jgi:hypothetical protein